MNRILAVILLISIPFVSCKDKKEVVKDNDPLALDYKIGQMIMVGFRGVALKNNDPIHKMITDYHLGGVVLYSRDLPSKETLKRNVSSPEQLKKLNRDLQAIDTTKLIIAIDEEGGFVTRLSVDDGFKYHKSHQAIGALGNLDSTKAWAKEMAKELSELGINMNFGPVIDLNINPKNPIIGARERSFSDSLAVVLSNANIFIKAHDKENVICVPKHFPGHGSSDKDSHKGLADVTTTWSKKELIPFKKLIAAKTIKVIMTSHVYNENLDTLPATLSPKIIKDLLRTSFDFKDVIISDDMQMRAISNFYDFETAIEKALESGVDMLLFSNNAAPCPEEPSDCKEIPFDPEIAKRAVTHVKKLVLDGIISEEQINQSYYRIRKLKEQL